MQQRLFWRRGQHRGQPHCDQLAVLHQHRQQQWGALHGNGNLTITSAYFQGNRTTTAQGGAVANFGSSANILVITDSQFYTNTAASNGGAVQTQAKLSSINNLFMGNRAAGSGGAVYLNNGVGITNTLFARNSASSTGQAVHHNGGTTVIVHTTIASPTLISAAAIYVPTGMVYVTNTLIASHTIGLRQTGGTLSENYNLFSNVANPYSGTVSSGGNSLTGTAAFINAPAGNYHLAYNSSAINTAANIGINTDLDDDARPLGGGFDIGYDEVRWYSVTVARTGTGSGSLSSAPSGISCGLTCTAASVMAPRSPSPPRR